MKRLKVIYTDKRWIDFAGQGWQVARSEIDRIGWDWLIDMARKANDTLIIHEVSP